MLREGWKERTRLPDLAFAFQTSETAVTRRVISLGLARTVVEVTDALGFTENGAMHLRRKLAMDPAASELAVLDGSDSDGVQHVSVHLTVEKAVETQQARGELELAWHIWTGTISGE